MKELRPRKFSNLPKLTQSKYGKASVQNSSISDLLVSDQALLPVCSTHYDIHFTEEKREAEKRLNYLLQVAQLKNSTAEIQTQVLSAAKAHAASVQGRAQQEAFG